MYTITIFNNDGTQLTHKGTPDYYLLDRMLVKCEIKSFIVSIN